MKKVLKYFFVIIIYSSFFSLGSPVLAQSSIPLMVMPARQEIEVDPGETTAITVNFYNQSNSPISGFFKTADFIVEDNQGTPKLIENPSDAPSKYSASSWISFLYDRATLPSNDKVSLQATIKVPEDAHPGGRYVAVFFEQATNIGLSTKNSDDVGMGTSSRIASLTYIKVKGPTSEKAFISRFFAPFFFEYGPIKLTVDIINRGDYHITPNALITMSNMFKSPVDQKTIKPKNIFPETSRTYEIELGKKWMAGRYKIDFSGSYGTKGQALATSAYVWVFPWKAGAAIILTLAVIYLILSNLFKNVINKEIDLEKEIEKEKTEIEKLKQALRRKKE